MGKDLTEISVKERLRGYHMWAADLAQDDGRKSVGSFERVEVGILYSLVKKPPEQSGKEVPLHNC